MMNFQWAFIIVAQAASVNDWFQVAEIRKNREILMSDNIIIARKIDHSRAQSRLRQSYSLSIAKLLPRVVFDDSVVFPFALKDKGSIMVVNRVYS